MNATSARRVVVESGGDQVVSHVGLHALGTFADQLGLGNALSARIPVGPRPLVHDRGISQTKATFWVVPSVRLL
jgi:hypothetical protein